MDENYKLLIFGNYNAFQNGGNGAGIYMISGNYHPEIFQKPIYIGNSTNLSQRIQQGHIRYLRKDNRPDNPILQNFWDKYGKDNFAFWLVEGREPQIALEREQFYLDKYKPFKDEFRGFNISHTVSGIGQALRETKRTFGSHHWRLVGEEVYRG